jgi:WD domain, G-beta repeat
VVWIAVHVFRCAKHQHSIGLGDLQRRPVWEVKGRPADLLIRGSELAARLAWRDQRRGNAPALTDLQRAFLAASEEEQSLRENAERKRLVEMAAAQVEREKAVEEREEAVKREAEAQNARARQRRIITWGSATAALLLILGVAGFAFQQTLNLKQQQELTRQGQITESHFRAEQAKLIGGDDAVTAALLALEGIPDQTSDNEQQRTRPFVNEAWHELNSAWHQQRERKVLSDHTRPVRSAVFAPDGHCILTAGDTTARLWDADGKPLATLKGHAGEVESAVFAPDGRRILTASDDNTARLWDIDGKELATLKGHTAPVTSAVFAPDGRRILTASDDITQIITQENYHAGGDLSAPSNPSPLTSA